MMHTVLVNKLGQPEGGRSDPIDITPGPGDYDPVYPRTIKCGGFSKAGTRPSSVLAPPPSPGPGAYNLELRPQSSGVIPFMGRGKTDTDLLIHAAKLVPGPGYYNLPDNKFRGGKIPNAKVQYHL